MKSAKGRLHGILLALALASVACSLTSPTPASWAGTPTAVARAETNAARTQKAPPQDPVISAPNPSPTVVLPSPTPQPAVPADGPWLVFPAPDGDQIRAVDLEANVWQDFFLPPPIILSDLSDGKDPTGQRLFLRAGSAFITDEMALYDLDLLTGTVTPLSPLLSISVQRRIVNQQGAQAQDTLRAVTLPGNLAWSPDGRYLAFTAALDNNSSDLYVLNVEKNRVDRLNGLYSHSAAPVWSTKGNWLVSVELGAVGDGEGWRAEAVSGLRIPGYTNQNTLYLPPSGSQSEVFVGWAGAQRLVSYSLTADGATGLRQVNVDTLKQGMIWPGALTLAALDPGSGAVAFVIEQEAAATEGLLAGVYLLRPESASPTLLRAGEWTALTWFSGGMFFTSGPQGVFAFSPDGQGIALSEESWGTISPNGSWIVAGGDGVNAPAGARLYQSASGNRLQALTDLKVDTVLWQPDSKAFFLLAEGSLYRLAFPGLHLEPIATGFPADQVIDLIWVD